MPVRVVKKDSNRLYIKIPQKNAYWRKTLAIFFFISVVREINYRIGRITDTEYFHYDFHCHVAILLVIFVKRLFDTC